MIVSTCLVGDVIYCVEQTNWLSAMALMIIRCIVLDRLTGSQPFWNNKQAVMLRSIITCQYSLNTDVWRDISESAKDMVCCSICYL